MGACKGDGDKSIRKEAERALIWTLEGERERGREGEKKGESEGERERWGDSLKSSFFSYFFPRCTVAVVRLWVTAAATNLSSQVEFCRRGAAAAIRGFLRVWWGEGERGGLKN